MRCSTWLLGAAALLSHEAAAASCQNVVIPVLFSPLSSALLAKNMFIPPDFDITNTAAFQKLVAGPVFNQSIAGFFSIAGVYCPPTGLSSPQRSRTLQLLIHGISSSKEYWSGLGTPGNGYHGNNYSYIATATAAGYPVLAIDRLGNGASSHPDPIGLSQLFANVEVVHRVITIARAGTIPGVSTKFDRIIVVGHSFGSLTTNGLTASYPNDADAVVLTGVTQLLTLSMPGVLLTAGILPAVYWNAARFINFALGYLVGTNKAGIAFLGFSDGGYDPPLLQRTLDTAGTFSVGEGVTAVLSPVLARNYKGPVYVINGRQDGIMCCLTGTPLSPRDCGSGPNSPPALLKNLYPAAKSFDFLTLENTGHIINLHYSGPGMFKNVQSWLAGKGF